MFSLIVFVSLTVLLLVHFLWQEWRLRQQQEQARQEFQRLLLARQQEAIAKAEAQQQALFNSMSEGVIVTDAGGRIQLTNQALLRLFRLSNDVRGRSIAEAFRLPELSSLLQRLEHEERIEDFELELAGEPSRSVQINAAVIFGHDKTRKGSIFVCHDLTRIKELEDTRKEFVANVSHELRTPLSMIKGFAETLLDGAKDDPEVSTRFLQNIDKNADRLLYLIEDLLTISRLESRQVALNQHKIALREIAARVIADLEKRAAEKGIIVQNEIPAELTAWADADRVQQVFLNLVENAIKYGKQNGRVELLATPMVDGFVEVAVRDDGHGIPVEAQERIFERFYRIDKARSRDTGGTGLGLAIVKHIVLAHGGRVWVNSALGNGTTFFFTVPAQR